MMPTASSSSGSFGREFPSISKISEYMSFDHFLPLDPLLYELFALLGKLFHFWSDLLPLCFFSWGGFSISMSTLTSFTWSIGREKTNYIVKKLQKRSTMYPEGSSGAYCRWIFQQIPPLLCYVFLRQQPCDYDPSETHSIYHTKAKFRKPCNPGVENQIFCIMCAHVKLVLK